MFSSLLHHIWQFLRKGCNHNVALEMDILLYFIKMSTQGTSRPKAAVSPPLHSGELQEAQGTPRAQQCPSTMSFLTFFF